MLQQRDLTAGEIAEHFDIAKSTLSGHFNVLRNAGLIVAEKHKTSISYSLNASVVEETMAAVLELFGKLEDYPIPCPKLPTTRNNDHETEPA